MNKVIFLNMVKIQKGFTLIELLVVIGLIVLMVGLATPLFQIWAGKTGIELGGTLVYTAVLEARQKAITKRITHYLYFEPAPKEGNPYMQIYRENSNPRNSTLEIDEDEPEEERKQLPNFVGLYKNCTVLATSLHYIGFRSNGNLYLPPGVQGVDRTEFESDPCNCDIGLMQPIDKPVRLGLMRLASITGRVADTRFVPYSKCSGEVK